MKKYIVAAMMIATCTLTPLTTSVHAADTVVTQTEKFIRTSGTATAQVKADGATLSLRVEAVAKKLKDAVALENSKRDTLLKQLAAAGIAATNIETIDFSTREKEEEVKDKTVLVGYIAQETLNVTVADVKQLPTVLGVPSLSNGVFVQNVVWTYSKSDELYEQLLEKAFKQAEQKAKRLAAPLQVSTLKAVNVEEMTAAPNNSLEDSVRESAVRVALQPGTITVQASIRATFTY